MTTKKQQKVALIAGAVLILGSCCFLTLIVNTIVQTSLSVKLFKLGGIGLELVLSLAAVLMLVFNKELRLRLKWKIKDYWWNFFGLILGLFGGIKYFNWAFRIIKIDWVKNKDAWLTGLFLIIAALVFLFFAIIYYWIWVECLPAVGEWLSSSQRWVRLILVLFGLTVLFALSCGLVYWLVSTKNIFWLLVINSFGTFLLVVLFAICTFVFINEGPEIKIT